MAANSADIATKATKGPWQIEWRTEKDGTPYLIGGRQEAKGIHTSWDHGQLNGPAPIVGIAYGFDPDDNNRSYSTVVIAENDARFIVAARDIVPLQATAICRLVAEIHRLQAYERCRTTCASTTEHVEDCRVPSYGFQMQALAEATKIATAAAITTPEDPDRDLPGQQMLFEGDATS
jgi:hypothetical protein